MTIDTIAATANLREVIARFREQPDLEVLPVVEDDGRPAGAVLERDIRRLLLNPFGHALLCNHSLYRRLDGFVSQVPVADAGMGLGHLFALISGGEGHDAVILTEDGRFRGVVSGRNLLRMAADREAGLAAGRAARLRRIREASEAMRAEAALLSREMTGASEQLEDAARTMNDRAGDAGAKGLSVMAAAAQAADNVGAIADQGRTLVEQLESLGREVGQARASTARVSALVEEGGLKARQLHDATREIGAVVETIDTIARRINLLALNATIEAAHAGAAGRGFAVVAAEVKALAQQTREAARHIAGRIMGVRSGVGEVAAGQAGIEAAMTTLDSLSSTIDDTVLSNQAAGARISANVRDAAGANAHIREQAAEISATASDAAAGSGAVLDIARSLTVGADRLQQRLGRFLAEIEMA
ncbi:chemotaxis protein [Sphingomonas sp. Root50]|nr:chemotaxis protein [Sphingomonas sp. Root1294]KQY66695.1 chemotaxis protein [Sphingomonas sp. Root50]KRB90427.1 chemotaxis protein [Sphingomonas sp. Root720]